MTFGSLVLSFIIIVLAFGFIYLFKNVKEDIDEMKEKEAKEKPALDLSLEEFYKTLNFMLLYGVITFEEYNELERKGLPYVR